MINIKELIDNILNFIGRLLFTTIIIIPTLFLILILFLIIIPFIFLDCIFSDKGFEDCKKAMKVIFEESE